MAILTLTGFRSHKTPKPTEFPFQIMLGQNSRGEFQVRYGKQLDERLDYATAAAKLGEAILHALACQGEIDNEVG